MKFPVLLQIAVMVLCAEVITDAYMLEAGYETFTVSPATAILGLLFIETHDLYVHPDATRSKKFASAISVCATFAGCLVLYNFYFNAWVTDLAENWLTFTYVFGISVLVMTLRAYIAAIRAIIALNATQSTSI